MEVTTALELGIMVEPLWQGCAEAIISPKKFSEDTKFRSRINVLRTMKLCRPSARKNHIAGIAKDELTLIVVQEVW